MTKKRQFHPSMLWAIPELLALVGFGWGLYHNDFQLIGRSVVTMIAALAMERLTAAEL